jgi:hypothetical protein
MSARHAGHHRAEGRSCREQFGVAVVMFAVCSLIAAESMLSDEGARLNRKLVWRPMVHGQRDVGGTGTTRPSGSREGLPLSASPHAPPSAPSHPVDSCPLVYVYNGSGFDHAELVEKSFGARLDTDGGDPWLFNSEQHGHGSLIVARLLRSRRCWTSDPSRAELFLVPLIFPRPRMSTPEEMSQVWDFMPPNHLESLWSGCQRLVSEDWLSVLPHLGPSTARRHFLLPLQYFDLRGFCVGADRNWSYARERDREVARLLALMPTIDDGCSNARRAYSHGVRGTFGRQRILSAPLVSSVHLKASEWARGSLTSREGAAQRRPLTVRDPPWAMRPPGARPWLMSYGGSTEGTPEAARLRKLLVRKCAEYHAQSNTSCRLETHKIMVTRLAAALQAKRESVFCLEPPGFGQHRKSQVDALTLGCIPVLFTTEATARSLWPHHWGGWRKNSSVTLDPQRVLNGGLDVLEHLRAIPAERVRHMQRTIAQNAHRMHYGLDDTPGDALELLLRALADGASAQAEAEDMPDPLNSDCADYFERRDACEQLVGPLRSGPDRGELALGERCKATTLPSKRLSPLLLSDMCARSCGLCHDHNHGHDGS